MKEETINALDSWVRAVGQELRALKGEVSGGSDVLGADFSVAERDVRDALQNEVLDRNHN